MRFLTRICSVVSAFALLAGCGAIARPNASTPNAADPTASARRSTPRAAQGWIRVAPGGRYLQTESGAPFFSLGHDEAFGFFFQPMNPKSVLEAYFQAMRARGENTILVEAENEAMSFYGGHRLSLEGPLGEYDESVAKQYDEMLTMAEKNGIYVITYLWDTFHMDWAWAQSPYNVKNGGPCTYASEMLTNPRAIALEQQKFTWAINRWGNRPNLLAWDLMNEIDWAIAGWNPANQDAHGAYHGASAEQMTAWVTEMGRFVKASELKRWGRAHLRTVSANNAHYPEGWLYTNSEIDLVTNHQYLPEANDPNSPTTVASQVRDAVHFALDHAGYSKPYMDTESGPLDWDAKHPNSPKPTNDAAYHASIWANWAAGAAGAGMRWPYPNFGFGGHPFLNPLDETMGRDLGVLATISRQVDWNSFQSRPATSEFAPADASLLAIASHDPHQLVGWLASPTFGHARRAARAAAPTSVSFAGFASEPHSVLWYDDTTGALLKQDSTQGASFQLATPAFAEHLAVVVRPAAGHRDALAF